MQLFSSKASPFVRKVRVTIAELGLTDRVTEVFIPTSPLDSAPEIVAANPLGKIPALTRPDGPALYDSRVITRYLDSLANGRLYPEGRLWEVLTLEATADAICEAALAVTYEGRFRSAEMQSAEWTEAQWGKAARALLAIEDRWMSHLAGTLDAGQIALGCALGYLDLRHSARDWRAATPALAAWYEGFSTRPSMVATVPVG